MTGRPSAPRPRAILFDLDDTILSAYGRPEIAWNKVAAEFANELAPLSHLAIVLGMVLIGYRHFDNIKTGIAAAVLYLLLPYTAVMTGRVTHVLPHALALRGGIALDVGGTDPMALIARSVVNAAGLGAHVVPPSDDSAKPSAHGEPGPLNPHPV